MKIKLISLICVGLCMGPGAAFATMDDIEAAIMNKDYVQAKQLAAKVLKDTAVVNQRVDAEYYLGIAELRLGRYAEARKAFQIVMGASVNPEMYDKAALGMIESLSLSGFYKDALKEGEQLIKRHPNSQFLSSIYLKIARANLKMMQWSKANEFLNKVINEFPESMEASVARQLMEEKEFFTVQVGSFVDRGRAISLLNQLKSSGQYAYVVETASTEGKKFYRVRVGQMRSLKDAQELERNLAKLGYPTLIYP